ncbi:MAG: Holliday junction resolvase [Crenarchaeota archaeon]|nr:Holliday junction resolvase [Thermoproteota archaeon]
MGDPKAKGFRVERELANKLWSLGFAVMRGAASGAGARKRFVPDLVAMKNGKIIVLELKYRSKENDTIRIEFSRISRLAEFAKRAGGRAYIAVKYGKESWRFIPLEDMEKLEKDSTGVKIRKNLVDKIGITLKQLIERELSESIEKITLSQT